MIALLYDIHGNLPALEAVLAAAEAEGVTDYVLGGDYAAFGPWPRETAELLETVPAVARIRGNVDRWLREEPDVPEPARELVTAAISAARDSLGGELAARLYGLPETAGLGGELAARLYGLPESAELDGMLICHGSPRSDVETFAPHPETDEEQLLEGQAGRTILFGHSHQQFRRPGPNQTLLVNPGSVGMPLDGDPRAAWALYADGEIRFERTAYDVERAVAQMRTYAWAETIVHRLQHGSDP